LMRRLLLELPHPQELPRV
jgi:hypothetical protein